MMKVWRLSPYALAIAVMILLGAGTSSAQQSAADSLNIEIPDTSHVQILKLVDGSELLGRTIEIGEDDILFRSELGDSRIKKASIRQITTIRRESAKPGGYWFPNPNVTRLYFAPTGRMMKKGEWYFSDYYLFFPAVTGAFSNRISVGAGMSLFPGLNLEDQLFYLTPEIGLYLSERLNFAVGAIVAGAPGVEIDDDDIPTFGAAYGVGSYGPPDAFITGGLAFAFAEDEFADSPAFLIGGQGRLTRHISFVSENWKFPETDFALISYGLRFFGSRMSFDMGFFNVVGGDENPIFPGVPWVDFVYNFKN